MTNQLFALVFCLVCSATDIQTRKIPNSVNLNGLLFGLAISAVASFGHSPNVFFRYSSELIYPILDSVLAVVVNFFLLILFYSKGSLGAADVKMASVIGAFQGLYYSLLTLSVGFMLAGMFAMVQLVYRIGAFESFRLLGQLFVSTLARKKNLQLDEGQRKILSTSLPMAVFFAIGAFVTLFEPFIA